MQRKLLTPLAALAAASLALTACASVDLRKDTFRSPGLTTLDAGTICAYDRTQLVVVATNSKGRLCSTSSEIPARRPLILPSEGFKIVSDMGTVSSNLVFTLDVSSFKYILVGEAGFKVECGVRPELSFSRTLPLDLGCYRYLDYSGARGAGGSTAKRNGGDGGEGFPGKDIDIYLSGLSIHGGEFMFLKVEQPKPVGEKAYFIFPVGTTNIEISVRGGDGGNGADGKDGDNGTAKVQNGRNGGNGGNAGRGGRAGRIKFFYTVSSAAWLPAFSFVTNAGDCGTPGYAGIGGLGFKSSNPRIANGRTGKNGYNGKQCTGKPPDGPSPFFMQYDVSAVLTDEISAGLVLK